MCLEPVSGNLALLFVSVGPTGLALVFGAGFVLLRRTLRSGWGVINMANPIFVFFCIGVVFLVVAVIGLIVGGVKIVPC